MCSTCCFVQSTTLLAAIMTSVMFMYIIFGNMLMFVFICHICREMYLSMSSCQNNNTTSSIAADGAFMVPSDCSSWEDMMMGRDYTTDSIQRVSCSFCLLLSLLELYKTSLFAHIWPTGPLWSHVSYLLCCFIANQYIYIRWFLFKIKTIMPTICCRQKKADLSCCPNFHVDTCHHYCQKAIVN